MKKRPSLRLLDKNLSQAAKLLDVCADQLRDLKLNPSHNIGRIGQALATIFEIQQDIYIHKPQLMPPYLKTKKTSRKRSPQ
jgi:hypothetical protein